MLGEIFETADNIQETSQQKIGCFGADIWLCAASRGLELFPFRSIWWLRECAVIGLKAWLGLHEVWHSPGPRREENLEPMAVYIHK